jgi:hypothetical protein
LGFFQFSFFVFELGLFQFSLRKTLDVFH